MESTVSHVNNDEDITKENKREIDNKVSRILKLIKSSGQDKKEKSSEESRKRSELIGLVQDFHKQYQSLYAQYDDVRGEAGKRTRGRKEKEKQNEKQNSSTAPSSDSEEYYSSDDIENGDFRHRHSRASSDVELETAKYDATGLRPILTPPGLAKESFNLRYMGPLGKSPRTRKRELSNLVKALELHGNQATAKVKDLEEQQNGLRIELESLRSLKTGLEKKLEEKEMEAKQFGETNVQLHSRVSELELISEDKGNEISAMTVRMEENESKLTSRIKVLMTEVDNLKLEMETLSAEKAELEERKRSKNGESDPAKILQQESESLHREKTELQLQLDIKTKEITENLNLIETLKEEIARKDVSEQGLLKEKEGLALQIEDLKLEVYSLHEQNNELEARISEMEENLTNKEQELSTVQKKCEDKENEASTQIMSLKAKLDSLLSEKRHLEAQNERIKQDCEHSQMQVENEILNLTNKIQEQQKTLTEKVNIIKKLTGEQRLTKHVSPHSQKLLSESHKLRSMDSAKISNQVLERKIDEMAEKFNMKMENHIRLLFQRIRVAEQIHVETKDAYKKMLEKLEQENKELNEKKAAYEGDLMKMREMLFEPENNLLAGLDSMLKKIDEENGNFLNRISRMSKELQHAKDWITGKNHEIKKLKHNVETLTSQLDEKEELEEDRLKVADKLERRVEDLEQKLQERDEILSTLGEEKIEAIRQLCVLIDYHRHRYDHLKEAVSKMPIKFKKPA
ncbi:COP1-interactive protein 1 [Manihot esculenta]|uniref:COP1-interactive protein 1 n=1 Tax=Manihot esculenta TaxID=3983 RepID=UPI001CC40FAF|nr:COP1-interactive protein 1 [Manihot esculenta]